MKKNKSKLMHIHKDQLPDRVQVAMDKNGFSIYRGVLIVWDTNPGEEIIEAVDEFVNNYPDQLMVVHFADNLLEMVWKDGVPSGLGPRVTDTQRGQIELDPSAYVIPVIFN